MCELVRRDALFANVPRIVLLTPVTSCSQSSLCEARGQTSLFILLLILWINLKFFFSNFFTGLSPSSKCSISSSARDEDSFWEEVFFSRFFAAARGHSQCHFVSSLSASSIERTRCTSSTQLRRIINIAVDFCYATSRCNVILLPFYRRKEREEGASARGSFCYDCSTYVRLWGKK